MSTNMSRAERHSKRAKAIVYSRIKTAGLYSSLVGVNAGMGAVANPIFFAAALLLVLPAYDFAKEASTDYGRFKARFRPAAPKNEL